MNLRWANFGGAIHFPGISPRMGKHCDVAHIVDPQRRAMLNEENPRLGIAATATSLAFDLMVAPNHQGHIVGPGDYSLDVLVAAENATPIERPSKLHYVDSGIQMRSGCSVMASGLL
jgi:hypothetical protein